MSEHFDTRFDVMDCFKIYADLPVKAESYPYVSGKTSEA
jgi:hypothetical protein